MANDKYPDISLLHILFKNKKCQLPTKFVFAFSAHRSLACLQAVMMNGLLLKLAGLLVSTAMDVAGLFALLSAILSQWEILEKEWSS